MIVYEGLPGAGKTWEAVVKRLILVCERHTFKPLYVIELDGRSHGSAAAKAKDAKRDAMLATAGIPVKRYTSSKVEFAVVLRDYMEVVGPAHSARKVVTLFQW
ncbi:DUF2726 domain-containing protein [Ralstonia solanacearum]|nr:DUF2726 domain-containing protein [Ralstonia solanacearum]